MRPEVSPEVILDGVAEDSSVLNQVLQHPNFLDSSITLPTGAISSVTITLAILLCYRITQDDAQTFSSI